MMIENFPMLPELIVIGTAFLILILDLLLPEDGKVALAPIAIIGLIFALFSVTQLFPHQTEMFGGRFVFDNVSGWFKIFFLLAGIITVAISLDLLDGRFANKNSRLE